MFRSNLCTNQQALGMREVVRGVVVKSWIALPSERMHFRVHNKIVVREAVEFYSACWRERCKVLYSPEHEKIILNKDIKQIKENAAKGENFNYKRHVELCHVNENITSIEVMRLWIKKLDSLEQMLKM